jgi:hypothetical protein
MEVGCLIEEFFRCCLHALVGVEVDQGHHHGEFFVELLLPCLHGIVEVFLRHWQVGGCGVVHSFNY